MWHVADYLPSHLYDGECLAKKLNLVIGLNRCPTREDSHPSCSLFNSSKGLILYDHALGKTIDLVEMLRGQGLSAAGCIGSCPCVNERQDKEIQISVERWNEHNIAYWKEYHISEQTLDLFSVFAVKAYSIDGVVYNNKGYCYVYPSGKVKLYFPNRRPKMLTNAKAWEAYPQWAIKPQQHLIITSSIKDAMVLFELGYNAIAFGSESASLKSLEGSLNLLSALVSDVYILYDADKTGLKFASRIASKYPFKDVTERFYSLVKGSGCKDPSDIIKKYGKAALKKILKRLWKIKTQTRKGPSVLSQSPQRRS